MDNQEVIGSILDRAYYLLQGYQTAQIKLMILERKHPGSEDHLGAKQILAEEMINYETQLKQLLNG
jgi:hypothetical protein